MDQVKEKNKKHKLIILLMALAPLAILVVNFVFLIINFNELFIKDIFPALIIINIFGFLIVFAFLPYLLSDKKHKLLLAFFCNLAFCACSAPLLVFTFGNVTKGFNPANDLTLTITNHEICTPNIFSLPSTRLTFDVENKSDYEFQTIRFNAYIYNGEELIKEEKYYLYVEGGYKPHSTTSVSKVVGSEVNKVKYENFSFKYKIISLSYNNTTLNFNGIEKEAEKLG